LISTLFTKSKFLYLLWLFLPVAFLPFFSWRAFILLIPGLLQNLLTNFDYQFAGFYQYDAILIPGVWVSAVYGIRFIYEHWQGKAILLAKYSLTAGIIAGFLFHSPINPFRFPVQLFKNTDHWKNFREIVQMVPDKVSVSSHTNLVPHLSLRKHSYMLGREPFAVDVVVIDTYDSFGFPGIKSFQAYVDSYYETGLYSQKIIGNRYLIFYRNNLLQ